jgi:hypothetical protein
MISKEARSVSVIATGLISIPFYSLFVDASGSDAVAAKILIGEWSAES